MKIARYSFFLLFCIAHFAHAEVSKIVFINQPQSLEIGQISDQYQIQLQNANGVREAASYAMYFTLPFTIGEFSSKKDFSTKLTPSSTIYISTGDYNKYFYFRSSISGDLSMKITAKNKDGSKSLSAEQSVKVIPAEEEIVLLPPPPPDPDILEDNPIHEQDVNTENPDIDTNNSLDDVNDTSVSNISSHSASENLGDFAKAVNVNYPAGRQRLGYVGVPVEFSIKSSKNSAGVSFRWTFGDGFSSYGQKTSHIYKFPGEYDVVLNSSIGDTRSVSRTKIKVIIPNISMSLSNGNIKIQNNGTVETNIGGWQIQNSMNQFIFPEDTIIEPRRYILITKDDANIFDESKIISLNNPLGNKVSFITPGNTLYYEYSVIPDEVQKPLDSIKPMVSEEIKSNPQPLDISKSMLFPIADISTSSHGTGTIVENIHSGFFSSVLNKVKSFTQLFYKL